MGFGSYDESEQERQQNDGADAADGSTVDAHENDHDGEASFEAGASTDDLVSRLQEMKDEDEDESDE
ncbi:death domain-associated protein [Halobacteriales archaeon QS_6_71_20]|nr:MAG: death domain-associated protein [Halobacteriales archaeon QS_6_71_20]